MSERGCDAVGIDLGTTYSALAYMDAQSVPRIVPTSSGQVVVPSVVFFDDEEIIVGDIAVQHAKVRSDRVVQFVKVHMGDEWRFNVDKQVHTPESVSAIILAHLIREAEPQIGPTRTAVITVPAYFSEKRRRATQQAGEIAGLTVIGTLNEPMAAALAYGLHKEGKEQTILVYDLGGGTFDVTVVRVTPNQLEELAICGNRKLGGKDWDQCLINLVLEDFQKKHKIDLRKNPEAAQALQDLQLAAELAKRDLTKRAKTAIRVNTLGKDHKMEVTRDQFEEATAHLLRATKLTTELALEDAKLRWKDVSRVVLVGGSTHMPMVRQMLKEMCGFPPDTGINPVTAVALGAAIYAQILETGKGPKALLREKPEPPTAAPGPAAAATPVPAETTNLPSVRFATAHGVGIKARAKSGRYTNVVLIPKNTAVPARASRTFYTQATSLTRANRIKIEVTQGDTPNAELAEVLGTTTISGIPENEPAGQPVQITMLFDEQGRLHLQANYVPTGQNLTLSLEIPGCLREDQVLEYRKFMEQSQLIAPVADDDDELPTLDIDDDEDDIPLLEPLP